MGGSGFEVLRAENCRLLSLSCGVRFKVSAWRFFSGLGAAGLGPDHVSLNRSNHTGLDARWDARNWKEMVRVLDNMTTQHPSLHPSSFGFRV